MTLEEVLSKKKTAVLKRWFNLIAQTYSEGGAGLPKNKDRFANPVGYVISSAIDVLYDAILHGELHSDRVFESLDSVIKVRAIQDFSPSQAIDFVFLLKKAIAAELKDEVREVSDFKAISRLESRVDELALRSFDIYMDCREKVCNIKVNEMKAAMDNALRLMERQSFKNSVCCQPPGQIPELEGELLNGYNGMEVE